MKAGPGLAPKMRMNIDQPRSDVKPRDVHHLIGPIGGDMWDHGGYLAGSDSDIARAVDTVLRINDVPSFEQQVVLLR